MEDTKLLKPFTILANGEFPNHKTIICTDGSANTLTDKGIYPSVIIGDMDSVQIDNKAFSGQFIKDSNQENTDLEKAFEWCIKNNVKTWLNHYKMVNDTIDILDDVINLSEYELSVL